MFAPFGRWIVLISSLGFVLYGLVAYAVLEPQESLHPSLLAPRDEAMTRVGVHVVFGALALLAGPWQFIPELRQRRPRLHRGLGYVYFASVLVSGVAGLLTSAIAYGGLVAVTGFGSLSMVWLLTGAKALMAAMRRDWVGHERWVLRNFALTFAAVTLRLHQVAFFMVGESVHSAYPVLAWICWVPNLLFVEWVLLSPNRRVQRDELAV